MRHECDATRRMKQEENKKENELIIRQTQKIWGLGFSRMPREITVTHVHVVDVASGTKEGSETS